MTYAPMTDEDRLKDLCDATFTSGDPHSPYYKEPEAEAPINDDWFSSDGPIGG